MTVIAIAHRLSNISRLDRIVMPGEARVAEDGRHDQLLTRACLYASFLQRRPGGFIGAGAGEVAA